MKVHFYRSKSLQNRRFDILRGFVVIAWIVCNTQHVTAQDLTPENGQIVPANAFVGGVEWINTQTPIRLEQLRGKFVLLDFWTYCCINCLQTLPDLKKIEQAYPNQLVVIGVHAPKFLGERDSENVREAVLRHNISHPVVNDANAIIARSFQVSGWPSLRLLDPQGNLIASHYGEITFESLNAFMKRVVPKYRQKRLLDETPLRFPMERITTTPTGLRFPGKVLTDSAEHRLFVADSGHHRIVILSLDGKWLETIGSGQSGFADGTFGDASFANPQGMALHGDSLYVADTDNHALRQVDLIEKTVKTVAGTGQQAMANSTFRVSSQPTAVRLASPWDLHVHEHNLYVAMAGAHQIWRLTLDRPRLYVHAGNGVEDIVDGPLLTRVGSQEPSASFAQPSGLTSDGHWLFVADSEGSSIRMFPLQGKGEVTTLLGTSSLTKSVRLFTFGDRDGPLSQALLQHPLGAAYASGKLFIADTYNNKIKEIDLRSRNVKTIAGGNLLENESETMGLNEPGGLSVADGILYVADTNNHVIRTLDLTTMNGMKTLKLQGMPPREELQVPALIDSKVDRNTFGTQSIRPDTGEFVVNVQITLPSSATISSDAPMSYIVRRADGDAVIGGELHDRRKLLERPSENFTIRIPLEQRSGTSTLELDVDFYYCQKSSAAICKMGNMRWKGTVVLDAQAADNRIEIQELIE